MNNYRVVEVTDRTARNGEGDYPVFGLYHSLDVWLNCLQMTYPETHLTPYLANVTYTEVDGFAWSYAHMTVTCEPERF